MSRLSPVQRSYLLLLLTTLVWGTAFVAQRDAMRWMPPFLYNSGRFGLAAAAVFLLLRFQGGPGNFAAQELKAGFTLGAFLWIGASFQQAGMIYTTASKAGFITGLYMVAVPLILLCLKHTVSRLVWLGVICGTVGLFLLSGGEGFSLNKGDLLMLLCAVAFGGHVVAAEVFARRGDPIRLAVIQYVTCTALSLLSAFAVEDVFSAALLPASPAIVYGGLISIAIGYTVQLSAQRHIPATPAALIMSLESVFAALAGYLLLDEILTEREVSGCILMLVGILLAQKPVKPGRSIGADGIRTT